MSFEQIQKNFGFGFMRLPMIGDQVDIPQTCDMVDTFLEAGFNYFDTAHGYIDGKSELAIQECLTSRYPRDRYILTNKLSGNFFSSREEIRPLLEDQLTKCGVEYFDFYLMHALNAERYDNYKKMQAIEECLLLKEEGKIRHIGMSFHDKAEVLDQILTDCPYIEVVQIQFNYVDYEDDNVESRKCYEVCRKHGKPVLIMEPVKGGSLVNLPASAQKVYDRLNGGSNASYAIRFAAGFEGVTMVLSGMSNMEQLLDNVSFMKDFQPLTAAEQEAVDTVTAIFRNQGLIPCTTCRYCTEVCPQGIAIPELFACLNAKKQEGSDAVYPTGSTAASECVKCGLCEKACPQNLNIRQLLTVAAAELE
ncbi:MAG: aldo/keto reductase [Oscillospiraceae bacterium]|nr:aldo/keto reductase [Oscillospiraceae bacterium]